MSYARKFFDKIDHPLRLNHCWEWTGPRRRGYGRFRMGASVVEAHRFSYEFYIGPIPGDLTIDHLCRNRACVNPLHLEAVTMRTNILRGISPAARNAVKTHCPKGHVYSQANTYLLDGRRYCRTCRKDATPQRVRANRERRQRVI